jgi:hypothetical protein
MLASAYKLAGKTDVANTLAQHDRLQAFVFTDPNPYTFGSLLRDRAVVLMGLTLLGRDEESNALLEDVSAQLSDEYWYSTQSVSFALVAVAKNAGAKPFQGFSFEYSTGKATKLDAGRSAAGQHHAAHPAGLRHAAGADQHLGPQVVRHRERARRAAQRRGVVFRERAHAQREIQ